MVWPSWRWTPMVRFRRPAMIRGRRRTVSNSPGGWRRAWCEPLCLATAGGLKAAFLDHLEVKGVCLGCSGCLPVVNVYLLLPLRTRAFSPRRRPFGRGPARAPRPIPPTRPTGPAGVMPQAARSGRRRRSRLPADRGRRSRTVLGRPPDRPGSRTGAATGPPVRLSLGSTPQGSTRGPVLLVMNLARRRTA
jgi:hypothetical protein